MQKINRIYVSVLFFGFFFMSLASHSTPIQLFLEPLSDGICRIPLEIKIYVLDKNGNVDTTFKGKKKLEITVKENGGEKEESFRILTNKVRFKKGVGTFSVEDQEPEFLELNIKVEDITIAGYLKVSFEDKDIFPPKIIELSVDEDDAITLKFDKKIEEESAQREENYKAVMNQREVYPQEIEYHKNYVILKFAQVFTKEEEGYIELEGIKDLNGNEISSGLRSPAFTGTACESYCAD